MKSGSILSCLTILIGALLNNGSVALANEEWGKTVNGLQMSLTCVNTHDFNVSIRNVSDHDIMLNLGKMLGPSKKYQFADAVTILVSDTSGKTSEQVLIGPPGVAGTCEPFALPLPPGATYSIKPKMNEYFERKTFQPIGKGDRRLTAKFQCKSANGPPNRNFWVGTVSSNTLLVRF